MKKTRDPKREEESGNFGDPGVGYYVFVADQVVCRSSETEAEGLVPPTAPETVKAFVRNVRKRAPGRREIPGLCSLTKYSGPTDDAGDNGHEKEY